MQLFKSPKAKTHGYINAPAYVHYLNEART